jgi:serine/threonine protein phosphatase PrpC
MVELRYASRTNSGAVREVNEDSVLARRPVFLVADGMGGHDAGDRASQTAVTAFDEEIPEDDTATVESIAHAYGRARDEVARLAETTRHGSGCTLSGAIMVKRGEEALWLIMNIGDSRVYALEDSTFEQLTVDHTLRDEYIAAGVDPADSRLPTRNVITRALGSAADEIDTWLRPVVDAQRILVCSDGLSGEVSNEQMRAVLMTVADAEAAADELVRLALDAGGSDNISVVIVDVVNGPDAEPDDATADTLDVTR